MLTAHQGIPLRRWSWSHEGVAVCVCHLPAESFAWNLLPGIGRQWWSCECVLLVERDLLPRCDHLLQVVHQESQGRQGHQTMSRRHLRCHIQFTLCYRFVTVVNLAHWVHESLGWDLPVLLLSDQTSVPGLGSSGCFKLLDCWTSKTCWWDGFTAVAMILWFSMSRAVMAFRPFLSMITLTKVNGYDDCTE